MVLEVVKKAATKGRKRKEKKAQSHAGGRDTEYFAPQYFFKIQEQGWYKSGDIIVYV